MGFYHFLRLESYFLKYKKFPDIWESSLPWNIRNVFRVSVSRNIRKVFFWENITKKIILEPESSISQNTRNFFGGGFFLFFKLGLKSSISWNISNFFLVDLFIFLSLGLKVCYVAAEELKLRFDEVSFLWPQRIVLLSCYLKIFLKSPTNPLHEKRTFVLWKFVKRTENIIFSLVFVCFRFTEISYFLNFPSNEDVRKQHLSVNAYYCINMKFSYTISGGKDEIFCVVL